MEFSDLMRNSVRDAALRRFLRGDANQFSEMILNNDLGEKEREFLADFVRANIPKGPVSPGLPKNNYLRIKAGLIRFWQLQDGYEKKSGISNYIGSILGCSRQRVEKILKDVDRPKTVEQAELAFLLNIKIKDRKRAIDWDDEELIALYREVDLQPIIRG